MARLTIRCLVTILAASALTAAVALVAPARAAAQAASCQTLSGGLSDSFETHYNAPGGVNPGLCPAVTPTVPGDNGSNRGTWFDNTTNYSVPSNCIEQAKEPTPGKGNYGVRFHANAGTGSLSQDCIWLNSWRYISYPADTYYGVMWYFPQNGYNDPSGGNHDITSEFDWHPFIYYGPTGYSLFGDTLQWREATGFQQKCSGCIAQYSNGAQYENPTSTQDNMGPITNWRIVPKGSLARNTWIETIVHVHWATDTTGSVQAWYRDKGSLAWVQTIDQSGFPTMDWGPDSSQSFTWTPSNQQGVTTMDHFGIYRTGDNPAPATTFWIDNFQRQTTFAAVANSMP